METPTILYLNNRYVHSLEELKAYFGSKLNEAQKGELIAAFRDKVLYDWLNEGGEAERQIAGDMLPILDQHLGNGEVLKKIAELFDVPNPLIADYKFVDYADYLGCYPHICYTTRMASAVQGNNTDNKLSNTSIIHVVQSVMLYAIAREERKLGEANDSMVEIGQIPPNLISNGGTIRLRKGQKTIKVVFVFKILSPENDFLSLRFSLNPIVENVLSNDYLKLDLGGKKNTLRSVVLEIDGSKLCKEGSITIFHGDTVVGFVTIDNHENTDKVIEVAEETIPVGYRKLDMAARVCKKQSINTNQDANNQVVLQYGFYDNQGNEVLTPELKLLKNPMYPDLDFGFYYRKTQDKSKFRLYCISEDGYQDLGVFLRANPLNKNLVAVRKTKDSQFFGIIDNTGNTVLEDKIVGKIYGINKDGCLVCEVRPGTQGLTDLRGKELQKDMRFSRYFVQPNSNLIFAVKEGSPKRTYFEVYCATKTTQFYAKGELDLKEKCSDIIALYNNDPWFIVKFKDDNGMKKFSRWCKLNVYFKNRYVEGDDLQIWLQKPMFPIVKNGNTYEALFDDSYNVFTPVVIAANSWMFAKLGCRMRVYKYTGKECFYSVDNSLFDGGAFVVKSPSENQLFLTINGSSIVLRFLVKLDDWEIKEKSLPGFRNCRKIESVVSYGEYISVRYLYQGNDGKETHCSLVISRDGEKVLFEDAWDTFSFVSGPFEGKYYFLYHGELYCMDKNRENVEKLTGLNANETLNASELYPLGTTGHFVIKCGKGYQIIDNQGTKRGKPFYEFSVSVTNCSKEMIMDYIYNSQYLPIKSEEGKCGLIDTNGKIIVPCEYDEVEDLNSVFKREWIVIQ